MFLQVNDGDDAYHMAIASVAESSGNMYTANVYAFGNTTLTYRYALAPFPIWIAYLSRISGVHTLTIAHIILGIFLITMSYVIYASSAKELFGDNRKKRLQMQAFFSSVLNPKRVVPLHKLRAEAQGKGVAIQFIRKGQVKAAHAVAAAEDEFLVGLSAAGGTRPDVVIIDPPRKGSTKELVDTLAELDVPRVVYVSCDPSTLARDCAWFRDCGYEIGDVTPVDMFPRTGHVESVVCITRK